MIHPHFRALLAGGAMLLAAGAGQAQLLPPLGALPGPVVGGVLGAPRNAPIVAPVVDRLNDIGGTAMADTASLLDLRRARLRGLIREHRRVLDADEDGNPVRKGELVAIDPSPETLDRARSAGFKLLRDERIDDLDLRIVTLAAPAGDTTREGLTRLRRAVPEGEFDFDHVFEPAGSPLLASDGSAAAASARQSRRFIGMIDGGVAAHPSLRNAVIEQRGFAAQGARPSGHGTAVASLMVGSDGPFRGAAPGSTLLVADVYGGDPTAGSAVTIARAFGWLTSRGVGVINVSLVGAANPVLAKAVAAARARGVLVVAAVGNDGPAAPPSYPASYSGVIAVTAVDSRGRALPEAGRALHLDFAAPGADMAAALPGSRYATVRGTSFAAPLVTARLALAGGGAPAVAAVSQQAVKGRGKVGRGIVCSSCRIAPREVGLKR